MGSPVRLLVGIATVYQYHTDKITMVTDLPVGNGAYYSSEPVLYTAYRTPLLLNSMNSASLKGAISGKRTQISGKL